MKGEFYLDKKFQNLLNVKQVVAKVNLTTARIYERIKNGTFPKGKKIGSARLWTVEEIENWLANRR